jgi:hypothetical protein
MRCSKIYEQVKAICPTQFEGTDEEAISQKFTSCLAIALQVLSFKSQELWPEQTGELSAQPTVQDSFPLAQELVAATVFLTAFLISGEESSYSLYQGELEKLEGIFRSEVKAIRQVY